MDSVGEQIIDVIDYCADAQIRGKSQQTVKQCSGTSLPATQLNYALSLIQQAIDCGAGRIEAGN